MGSQVRAGSPHITPCTHTHTLHASGELSTLALGFPSNETWLPACLPKPLAVYTLSSGVALAYSALQDPLSTTRPPLLPTFPMGDVSTPCL